MKMGIEESYIKEKELVEYLLQRFAGFVWGFKEATYNTLLRDKGLQLEDVIPVYSEFVQSSDDSNNTEWNEQSFWEKIDIEPESTIIYEDILTTYFNQGEATYAQWALSRMALSNELKEIVNQITEYYSLAETVLDIIELISEKKLINDLGSRFDNKLLEYERLVDTRSALENYEGFNYCLSLRDFWFFRLKCGNETCYS